MADQLHLALDRPDLNVYDMPELMDGARPGATNVQREAFQARCKQVWREDQYDDTHSQSSKMQQQLAIDSQLSSFLEMFATVDPSLVRSLYYEMGAEMCLAQLLILSETADAATASQVPTLDRNIKITDRKLFPSLTDSNGWEIVSPVMLKEDQEERHTWRDRCELVKDFPPVQCKPAKMPVSTRDDLGKKKVRKGAEDSDGDSVLNEVDLRRECGERRAVRKGWGRKRVPPASPEKENEEECS